MTIFSKRINLEPDGGSRAVEMGDELKNEYLILPPVIPQHD